MYQLALRFWRDDEGALLAMEWVFLATILVIGGTAGLVAVRNAVNAELTEVANATLGLNQCYSFNGLSICGASVCGSAASDTPQTIPMTQTTPNAGIPNINVLSCPDVESALPAVGTTGGVVRPALTELRTGNARTTEITPTIGPALREACTDTEPGARDRLIRPVEGPMKTPEECTDKETGSRLPSRLIEGAAGPAKVK